MQKSQKFTWQLRLKSIIIVLLFSPFLTGCSTEPEFLDILVSLRWRSQN